VIAYVFATGSFYRGLDYAASLRALYAISLVESLAVAGGSALFPVR